MCLSAERLPQREHPDDTAAAEYADTAEQPVGLQLEFVFVQSVEQFQLIEPVEQLQLLQFFELILEQFQFVRFVAIERILPGGR